MNDPAGVKSCCADIYASDWARLLLGSSFHPGGLELTERLGTKLGLDAGSRVLDVAPGRGASGIHLARHFGCEVIGIDYSPANVTAAQAAAGEAGLAARARFQAGDAERLPVEDGSFDSVICECALCTFPDKTRAVTEMARVLRPGGRIGISDLVRRGALPPELDDLLAWVACIADARAEREYLQLLDGAGFSQLEVENHDRALSDLARTIKTRLLVAKAGARIKRLDLPALDLDRAGDMAQSAERAIVEGKLGYVLITGRATPQIPA